MFVFGHLGIGSKIVGPWSHGLKKRWVLLGTLLPDLIDKPLYYGLSFATGRRAEELGLISGTRTFGHTALFLLLLALIAFARRSKLAAALALGVASHLVLDATLSGLAPGASGHAASSPGDSDMIYALLFPFMGFRFPVMPFLNSTEHLSVFLQPFFLITEIVGVLLLSWDYWKLKNRVDILKSVQFNRWQRKLSSRLRRRRPPGSGP